MKAKTAKQYKKGKKGHNQLRETVVTAAPEPLRSRLRYVGSSALKDDCHEKRVSGRDDSGSLGLSALGKRRRECPRRRGGPGPPRTVSAGHSSRQGSRVAPAAASGWDRVARSPSADVAPVASAGQPSARTARGPGQ